MCICLSVDVPVLASRFPGHVLPLILDESMCVRVRFKAESLLLPRTKKRRRTFAIRARRYERSRNLNRSSSVCMTTREKLLAGSMFPVISSTSAIYCRPISGMLVHILNPIISFLLSFTHHKACACPSSDLPASFLSFKLGTPITLFLPPHNDQRERKKQRTCFLNRAVTLSTSRLG